LKKKTNSNNNNKRGRHAMLGRSCKRVLNCPVCLF